MPYSSCGVGENGWSLPGGHFPWSPTEAAPSPFTIFSHRWVSPSVHLNAGAPSPWHRNTVQPLNTLGELHSCSSQEDILCHLSLPLPQTPWSGPLPSPLPPPNVPAFLSLLLGQHSLEAVQKSERPGLEMWCVCSYRVFTKYLQMIFNQLASTVRNNLSTGYLPGLLRGKKMLIILI